MSRQWNSANAGSFGWLGSVAEPVDEFHYAGSLLQYFEKVEAERNLA